MDKSTSSTKLKIICWFCLSEIRIINIVGNVLWLLVSKIIILGVMGSLCAPARDEKIAELKATTKIVPLFKGKILYKRFIIG